MLYLLDILDVVGRRLIYEIVEPIGIEQICTASPTNYRFLRVIVIREIILRYLDRKSRVLVAHLFLLESVSVVLGVSRNEDLSSLARSADENSRLFRACEYLELRNCLYIFSAAGGVS